MRKVIKKAGKIINAYQLGSGSDMEKQLLIEGRIHLMPDGSYRLISQEVDGGKGEKASAGDYFKVDSSGYPYPNKKEWFEKNHSHIGGDQYMQHPYPLDAWETGQPFGEVMDYLLRHEKLFICEDSEKGYFRAFLWGEWLLAAKDAVVVFYEVTRDVHGAITAVEFNFVARDEFEKTYDYIDETV